MMAAGTLVSLPLMMVENVFIGAARVTAIEFWHAIATIEKIFSLLNLLKEKQQVYREYIGDY